MESHPGLARVCPDHPGHGSTRRVDRVWSGRCTGWSFDKPGQVQTPRQSSPGSNRRAGPGLISMRLVSLMTYCLRFSNSFWCWASN
jgi:hypothetical protein